LEDIEEAPYRVDRMLTYLKTVGKLKGVRGILFGTMEKCQTETGKSYHLTDVLMDCLKDFPGPILYGFPSGHGEHNVTIPLGVKVSLDGANGELKLLERGTLD
jgi:muramoyltetrapeptide carboxypeptidase